MLDTLDQTYLLSNKMCLITLNKELIVSSKQFHQKSVASFFVVPAPLGSKYAIKKNYIVNSNLIDLLS